MEPVRLLATVVGAFLVVAALFWAMQVSAVKNAEPPLLARPVFRGVGSAMYVLGMAVRSEQRRRQIWALYVLVSLLAIVVVAIAQILVGYTLVFCGISRDSMRMSYVDSLSSLSVLGFGGMPSTLTRSTIALMEAFAGPIFVALLISYLANINESLNQRQAHLRSIELEVGKSRSRPELLERAVAGPGLDALTTVWKDWVAEFVRLDASHSSVERYLLVFSPGLHNHWVADAQTVLDAANFRNAVFDAPSDPQAARCLTEGGLAIANAVAHSRHLLLPRGEGPLRTVSRSQFDDVCASLAAKAALMADRDAAWTAFEERRATYEGSVAQLARLMRMPTASWP